MSLVLKVSESRLHVLKELVVVALDLLLPVLHRVLELHAGQLVHDLAHALPGW